MSDIERFAVEILDQRELQLARHLALLLDDDSCDSSSLVEDIIPIYWQQVGDICQNLHPGNIYRPLYYIHSWSSLGDFKNRTRAYIDVISSHLEGCLENLTPFPSEDRAISKTFGPLVARLKKAGVLSPDFADQLWKFNAVINVPAKHFGAYAPTRRLDERTFTVMETTCALVIMRKLSIQLFELLKANGITLPHEWPEFKDEWLSWSPKIN